MTSPTLGGELTFYGQDPIIASPFVLRRSRHWLGCEDDCSGRDLERSIGQGQDIHVDVRKAFRRFSGFFEGVGKP